MKLTAPKNQVNERWHAKWLNWQHGGKPKKLFNNANWEMQVITTNDSLSFSRYSAPSPTRHPFSFFRTRARQLSAYC